METSEIVGGGGWLKKWPPVGLVRGAGGAEEGMAVASSPEWLWSAKYNFFFVADTAREAKS